MNRLIILTLLIIGGQLFAGPNEDLWNALKTLDADGVKAAIAAGANVNQADPTFGLPIHYAGSLGTAGMIKALVDARSEIDPIHPANKFTPLLGAVLWGNADAVKALLAAGAKTNVLLPTGNIVSNAIMGSNKEVLRLLASAGVDFKSPIMMSGSEIPVMIAMVLMYKTPTERVEALEAAKPAYMNMGILKLPDWVENADVNAFAMPDEMITLLKAGGADVNEVQAIKGTKVKKVALSYATEMDKPEIADALIAAGADKNGPGMKEANAIAKANAKPTPFSEATSGKIKVSYDFPREGRKGNGGGYSANLDLLKTKPKRVALISYYVYDAGNGKASGSNAATATTSAWSTPVYTAQQQASLFYNKSIEQMKAAYKDNGIDLLTPDQFLDTEEKKEIYYGFNPESAKREKTDAKMFGKLGTMAEAGTTKACPAGRGYRVFFVANEEMDKSAAANFQGGVFSANRKLTSSLGYELCRDLGVDAVMVVYIATRQPKLVQPEYGVNAVVSIMLGPNPGKSEDADADAKNLGQFYCGTRTFYSEPVIFQLDKARAKPDGIENVLTAHAVKMSQYVSGKEKD